MPGAHGKGGQFKILSALRLSRKFDSLFFIPIANALCFSNVGGAFDLSSRPLLKD
jgi:hypothetical protein